MEPRTTTSHGRRTGAREAQHPAVFWHYLAATIALVVLPALGFASTAPTIQLFPTTVRLTKIVPARNQWRFYLMQAMPFYLHYQE